MFVQTINVCFGFSAKDDFDGVGCIGGFRVVPDADDVTGLPDDSFREQEASREFFVVAGCAHGDGNAESILLIIDKNDFKRLFNTELIGLFVEFAAMEAEASDCPDGR